MDKKYVAYGLIFLNVLLQIASCLWYRELPGFVWTLANAILILVPLVFGLQMGVLCLLPVAASELLYQGLRLLVLQKPVQWDSFFGEIFSPVILVVLLLLVTCINCSDSESQERSQK